MHPLRPSSNSPAPAREVPAAPRPASVLTSCDLVPIGNGNFRSVPRRPRSKLTITEAARLANYSRTTTYRLYRAGFIVGEKQSPRKILIDADSLQAHLVAVRDPACWTPSRRAQYWSV